MTKVHALAIGHKADAHNPGDSNPVASDFVLAYRTALCGQTRYAKRVSPARYHSQFGELVCMVADSELQSLVTCGCCRRIAKFG